MRSLVWALGFALVATSSTAAAAGLDSMKKGDGPAYGDKGTIEVGGLLGFESVHSDFKTAGKQDETLFAVEPQVGMFISPGAELLVQLDFVSDALKPEGGSGTSISLFGGGVGGDYLVKTGSVFVGPELILQYANASGKFDFGPPVGTVNFTQSGPGATAGLLAKLPLGGGGVVTLGASYQYQSLSFKLSSSGASETQSGTMGAFGTSVGYSVYFGGGS